MTFYCHNAPMTTIRDEEKMNPETRRDQQFSIGELSREAGVSVRTIRYYIAEGLLPPTESGPRAVYTRAHLDRLRLIGRMKNEFLPLKEIRRHLATLDDDEIRRLAEEMVVEDIEPMPAPMSPRMSAPLPEPVRRRAFEIREEPSGAADYIANVLGRTARDRIPRGHSTPPRPHDADQTTWKRIPLGDAAELLIESDAYERRKEKVDWLVDWARKVLS
jgi:DNA-binding transcriptional MerR regulator